VREKLGDTGSLTTIAEHLRAIHTERQAGAGPVLPDPLVQKLVEGASGFWRDLTEAADQIVAEVRAAAAADIEAAQLSRDEAVELAARARDELGVRRATLDTLERHLADSTARLERTETELAAARAAQEAAERQTRVHRDARDAHERELVAARMESERQGVRWQEERVAHDAGVEALERTASEAQIAHQNERDELTTRLEQREARCVDMSTALARVEEQAAALGIALEERTSERSVARDEATSLRTRLQAATETHEVLGAKLAAAARETETAALLEQLVADDRTGRVLALLESIDARFSEAQDGNRRRKGAPRKGS